MQISEKFDLKTKDVAKAKEYLSDYGYCFYKAKYIIIDMPSLMDHRDSADAKSLVKHLNRVSARVGTTIPVLNADKEDTDFDKGKPYFVCTSDAEPINGGQDFTKSFFSTLEELFGKLEESKKVYSPYFYKYITEHANWDVQPEEIYWDAAKMEELYQEYMKEIDSTVDQLKKLKKDGKEDTPEFSSFILKLNDLAPDLAKEFKAS